MGNAIYTSLQKTLTIRCPTPTWQLSIVVGRTIVAGQFFAFLYGAQGVKLYFVVGTAHIGIRLAGMVDVAQLVRYGGIQRGAVAKLYNGDG